MIRSINLSQLPAEYLRHLIENEPLINKDNERLKLFSVSAFDNMSVIAKPAKDFQAVEAIAIFDKNSECIRCFNPTKNTWKQMHEMDDDMKGSLFSAICVDNYIYVFKPNKSVHRLGYVDESAEWEHVGDTIDNHGSSPVVALKDCIYVVGGSNHATKSVEKYNIHSRTFTKLPDKQHETYGSTLLVSNDKIYSCGGFVNCTDTNIVECFDPDVSSWTTITPMNENKRDAAAVELDDKLYIVGGWSGNKCLCTVECHDPTTAKWSVLKSMNAARDEFRCFVIDRILYAVGGREQGSTIEKYDPTKNQWTNIGLPDGLNLRIFQSVKINLKP